MMFNIDWSNVKKGSVDFSVEIDASIMWLNFVYGLRDYILLPATCVHLIGILRYG